MGHSQRERTFYLIGHSEYINSISFSPDGKILASGYGDSTIILWDVCSGKRLFTLRGCVSSISFRFDGKVLTSGSNYSIRFWDVESGKEIRSIDTHHRWISSISFSPDGKELATGDLENTIALWDVVSGKYLWVHISHYIAQQNPIAFSADGKVLASEGDYHSIKLWDVISGKELSTSTWRFYSRYFIHVI